jgi:metal-responsive CopG/Arc/MetJ family transcriptional regulator
MESALKTERIELRAPTDFLKSVDEWRRRQPDLPSRSEAIRRLVELGLKAKK